MLEINGQRLLSNLEELGKIGENELHGIDRWFGSETDLEAREWLRKYWTSHLDGKFEIDAIANLWLKDEANQGKKPIVIGSHHDAVPCGGKYDGAMGVLIATEIIQTLQEQGVQLQHPLHLLAFTGEEPNPFNVSTLGSKVLCGRLVQKDLEQLSNRDNHMTMADAVKRAGGEIHKSEQARLSEDEIGGFIECHIEQGHRLEDLNQSVAAVSAITGIYREEIEIKGEANHAGTTPMEERKDAFLAAAEIGLALEEEIKKFQAGKIVGTVGCFHLMPNEASIIPETVKMITDIRTCEQYCLDNLLKCLEVRINHIIKKRNVAVKQTVILNQQSMPMNQTVIKAIQFGMQDMEQPDSMLNSMAGHDAANMARICPAGMIFVQSVNGKSHCKEEYTRPEDIVMGANVMLQAVLHLDEMLE